MGYIKYARQVKMWWLRRRHLQSCTQEESYQFMNSRQKNSSHKLSESRTYNYLGRRIENLEEGQGDYIYLYLLVISYSSKNVENTNILLFVVSGWSQMMKNETNDVFDINILLCFENCYMKPFLLVPGTVELLGFRYKIQLVI